MRDEETAAQPPEPTPGSAGQEAAMAPEISRRVGSILDAVEREAARLREDAQAEAARYSEHARHRADDLVAERQRRIAELSDELVHKSEAVVARLDDAAPVREGFENLVRALGDAAERLSRESEETAGDFAPPPFHEGASQPVGPPPAYGQPSAGPPPYEPPPQEQPLYEPPPQPAVPAHQPARPSGSSPDLRQPAAPYEAQPHPARAPAEPDWQPVAASPPPPPPPSFRQAPNPTASWRELDEARMVAIQMASAGSTRGDVRGHLGRVLGIPDPDATLDEIFGAGTGDEARVPWMTGRR